MSRSHISQIFMLSHRNTTTIICEKQIPWRQMSFASHNAARLTAVNRFCFTQTSESSGVLVCFSFCGKQQLLVMDVEQQKCMKYAIEGHSFAILGQVTANITKPLKMHCRKIYKKQDLPQKPKCTRFINTSNRSWCMAPMLNAKWCCLCEVG